MSYVTGPKTGLQRRSKWPPTISEVLEACEQHQDYLRKVRESRPVKLQRLAPPAEAAQGSWANVFVPEGHVRYERLVEWTRTAEPRFWRYGKSSDGRDGLWVALDVWQGTTTGKRSRSLEAGN